MAQFTVFLSSTPPDLQPYGDAVLRAVEAMDGHHGVRVNDFGTPDGPPEDLCRRQVAAADVYVGLIGPLYGRRPSGSEFSYTEIEYDEATKRGKPLLLFVAADDLPLAPPLREPDAMWQRQKRFRAKILEDRVVDTFREPGELAAMVVAALQRHQVEVAERAVAAPAAVQEATPNTFLSYSRKDSEFALRLAQDLRQKGASIWLDQLDIGAGQRWDSAVEEALHRCPRQVTILSPAAVSSDNVMDEVSFALEERKQIIPVLYRDCQVPFRLRRQQRIDFRTDYDRGLRELLEALGIAGAPRDTRHPPPQRPGSRQRTSVIVVGAVSLLAAVLGIWYMVTNHLGPWATTTRPLSPPVQRAAPQATLESGRAVSTQGGVVSYSQVIPCTVRRKQGGHTKTKTSESTLTMTMRYAPEKLPELLEAAFDSHALLTPGNHCTHESVSGENACWACTLSSDEVSLTLTCDDRYLVGPSDSETVGGTIVISVSRRTQSPDTVPLKVTITEDYESGGLVKPFDETTEYVFNGTARRSTSTSKK
jgi:hypothetical protein